MGIRLLLAPAGHGKTVYVLEQVKSAVSGLAGQAAHVCVPTALQARAWRRLLAREGAIGVRVVTFTELYQGCLDAAGECCLVMSDAVQARLLQRVVAELDERGELRRYGSLRGKPGFIEKLQELLNELKAARIPPDDFAAAASTERLRDLARIYARYEALLQKYNEQDPPVTDMAGLAERAVLCLTNGDGRQREQPRPPWSLLAFDGFDVLNHLRIAFVSALGAHYPVLVTLTGPPDGAYSRPVHRRFEETHRRLQEALAPEAWSAEPLPEGRPPRKTGIRHLEAYLFRPHADAEPHDDSVACHVAPDHAGEVFYALRWLKERVEQDGLPLEEVALVAREIDPYRDRIEEVAKAAGLPVRFEGGVPLRRNPAVAAFLALLRLFAPDTPGEPRHFLSRRGLVAAWRSPYFDWGLALDVAITPEDAEQIEAAAYWGRVHGGCRDWVRALRSLSKGDESRPIPEPVPKGAEARQLRQKLGRFVRYMGSQTQEPATAHEFVRRLERMIGPDGETRTASLNLSACAREHAPTAAADVAALRAFKELLRGIVWAHGATELGALSFAAFLDELESAVDSATYQPPTVRPALTVARLFDMRGVPLQAVALLGMAEGFFPPGGSEEILLRDADRRHLNQALPQSVPFLLRLEQDERPLFYDTVSRPREKLLLTRPHRADDGSEWPASAYWEEVRRLLPGALPDEKKGWRESIALSPTAAAALAVEEKGQIRVETGRWEQLVQAAAIFRQRYGAQKDLHDGHCYPLTPYFGHKYGEQYRWSPSQLQKYTTCPFYYFVDKALGLARLEEPEEDPQALHLGSIYHAIFEELFRAHVASAAGAPCTGARAHADLIALLENLDDVADRVLAEAPRRFGFRPPPWWTQLQQRIKADVRRSLPRLAETGEGFAPLAVEAEIEAAIPAGDGEMIFRLFSRVDRIDRDEARNVRLIDYKLGSPSSHDRYALRDGKKIQLPLYARAVQEACNLDQPPDGFYWHVGHAEASDPLSHYWDGVPAAVERALEYAREAIAGARAGRFEPDPPDGGCPSYCTAAGFCWHYTPRFGG
ncbi:MAG: PD-(D/E)XK nuclease family protein [Candidatus Promineifilaceae bacterium]|nr:PD-(D/E)XK nuclease family protein [Candidatus Promineifilaceae bacterium]